MVPCLVYGGGQADVPELIGHKKIKSAPFPGALLHPKLIFLSVGQAFVRFVPFFGILFRLLKQFIRGFWEELDQRGIAHFA